MADNTSITPGAGAKVASDEAPYSGDTTQVQIIRLVHVTGAEGSKVISELVRLEDAAHTSGDPGIPTFGVRKDVATALAGSDGDYMPAIYDASGQMWVNVGASALPAGAATAAKQDTAKTAIDAVTAAITAGTVGVGQTTKSASVSMTMASDQGEVGKVYTGTFSVAGATLTRPANTTAYTANQSVSNNATAGSVTALTTNNLSDTNDVPVDLAEILLTSTDTGAGGVQFRIHLFNTDPTASSGVVGGNGAAWSNKQAGWVGSFSGTMRAFSDGARGVLVADEGTLRLIAPVSGAKNLYWQLQVLGAYTPAANSTTFIPTFKGFQARVA